jgi:hypothetical protein
MERTQGDMRVAPMQTLEFMIQRVTLQ